MGSSSASSNDWPVGATWIRADLHVHTPFDAARTMGCNVQHAVKKADQGDDQQLRDIAYRFFDACADAKLDLVALTDHNTVDGYERLSPFLEQWQRDRGEQLVLLPGVEVTFGDAAPIHALVLFREGVSADTIDRYLKALSEGNSLFGANDEPISVGMGPREFTSKTRKILEERLRVPFLVLPAHVDSDRGLRQETAFRSWIGEFEGSPRQIAFSQALWSGFQVRGDPARNKDLEPLLRAWAAARIFQRPLEELTEDEQQEIESRTAWPFVAASDPHELEQIGSSFTWMKVDVPSLEGVRLALLDPGSRLRRDAEGRPDPPPVLIRSLDVEDTDFFEEVHVGFNPALNTLIGGRGTGKSMAIELLRYALDRARPEDFTSDEREVRERTEKVLRQKPARDFGEKPGVLLPSHAVTATVEVQGRIYRIRRDPDGFQISVGGEHGADERQLDVRKLIAPRILSQRQIATIAQAPEAQRRELDALRNRIDREELEFRDRSRELLGDLQDAQRARNRLTQAAKRLSERQTELQSVSDRIGRLEEAAEEDVLDAHRAITKQRQWLERYADALDVMRKQLAQLREDVDEAVALAPPPEGPAQEPMKNLDELLSRLGSRIDELLSEALTTLERAEANFREIRDDDWDAIRRDIVAAYTKLTNALADSGVSFDEHDDLVKRREQLRAEIQALTSELDGREEVERKLVSVRDDLVGLHRERARQRAECASRLEVEDADIRMTVRPFGDRQEFIDRMRRTFEGTGMRGEDLKVMAAYVFEQAGDPESIPARLWELLQALRDDLNAAGSALASPDIDQTNTASLVGDGALSGYFIGAVERAGKVDLEPLERYIPDDFVETRVRRTAAGDFVPIEQGSVGQQATAILSLLLAAGDEPLVLDQPEDDLDNQYVYSVVVDLLRKRKTDRQVILATHNANIPVNGDAECIIEMKVEGKLGAVAIAGSIDRPGVKDAVSRIMEGSAEAFRLRKQRYNY